MISTFARVEVDQFPTILGPFLCGAPAASERSRDASVEDDGSPASQDLNFRETNSGLEFTAKTRPFLCGASAASERSRDASVEDDKETSVT